MMINGMRRLLEGSLIALASLLLLLTTVDKSQALNYATSYFGNSFPGTPNQLHMQDDIYGMYVTSDGACYANSSWEEDSQEAGIYKNGQVTGNCVDLHAWGRDGGVGITADANYVYVGMVQTGDGGGTGGTNSNGLPAYPPANTEWYCVRRYTRAGAPAPFSTGYGYDGSMLVVNTGTKIVTNVYTGSNIGGIAVDSSYLYVTDPISNLIKKYSLSTLSQTPVLTWSVTSPGSMVLGGYGGPFVWVIQGSTPVAVAYTTSGTVVAAISFAGGVKPSGLAYNISNNTLLVADAGPDQNIKCYNLNALSGSPTTVSSVVGTVGGIYAGTGATIGTAGLLRFNNPTGVGVDSSGNVYVCQDGTCNPGMQGGGAVLESYTSAGARNWWLYCLEYVDCSDIDPSSETSVFSKDKHFVMNWANITPGSEATYQGYTLNRFKYPEDPRLHQGAGLECTAWVREFLGHKFLVTTDMWSNNLIVSRFNTATDGECAIPSTVFGRFHITPDSSGWPENQPGTGEWIWRDANGNGALDAGEYTQPAGAGTAPSLWGWWMDSSGDVWEATQTAGIRHFACQGLDSYGNPIYNYAHMTTIAMPSQFNDLERIEYYPATDTMYLAGYSPAQSNTNGDWKIIGKVICRYDHWSTSPTLHAGYPLLPAFSDTSSPPVQPASMSVTGQYLFVTYAQQNQVLVYNLDTAALAGTITPGSSVGGTGSNTPLGWTDIPYGVRAYQRATGEYEIFNEDDWLGKIVMYRWTPVFQIQNYWLGTYINTQSGLQCTTISPSWWSAGWIEQPTGGGTFALSNEWTLGLLNISSGSLQCGSATGTAAEWTLGDDSGYNTIASVAQPTWTINTESGLECTLGNPSWWSEMWTLTEVN